MVPNHHELKVGTLASVLKQAGVSADAFIEALRQ
ncbi:MAG: type II toxin-antitoxin system HicA family toxin [Xanthomonadales bacterium]|nr:type II toxin-antitoxin system HicA family toxin [Xanthomonadales bacterium]